MGGEVIMTFLRAFLCAALLPAVFPIQKAMAQGQQAPSNVPTFQVTSTLVFLDVTVLDKQGHPVVTGLAKDDFTITEDRKPQRIFSFEAPETHVVGNAAGDNPDGNAPITIFVVDELNSSFEDFAFIRYSLRKFLQAQPAQLTSPAELLVVGDQSLEMLQGYTRSRADMLYALDHLPATLPFKQMHPSFFWERFGQSIDALQQIALQNKGVPGRKNIVWVGHGGPGIYLDAASLPGNVIPELTHYVHTTTNMLVDSRISLFVIYPGLKVGRANVSLSARESDAVLGDSDPFAGDINFGVFVNETGGKLFYNRNDVDKLIARSQQMGSNYYTLTYQPEDVATDGKFRRIRVTLRNPNLRVVTKAGYFAPDKNQPVSAPQQSMINLAESARSTIPFSALGVELTPIARHPDSRSAELRVQVDGKNLDWIATDDGKSAARLMVAAVSLDGNQKFLASRIERVAIQSVIQDPARRAEALNVLQLTVRVPQKTQSVRVVVETDPGGRIGTAALDRKVIDASPATPSPEPNLAPHRPDYVRPATP
jgi:VWFA-related protein